jgi:hypothetical protein
MIFNHDNGIYPIGSWSTEIIPEPLVIIFPILKVRKWRSESLHGVSQALELQVVNQGLNQIKSPILMSRSFHHVYSIPVSALQYSSSLYLEVEVSGTFQQ